jgi:DNA-binding GntR family transcriptional regulator
MSDTPEPELPQTESFATSSIVTTVFEAILADVHEGRLLPGTRISDSDLAEKLGVSRTPVREALQRLREIGIIEASANRFTRIAIVSPQQTADAMVVWVALYGALVSEVIGLVPPSMVQAMRYDHDRFVHHLVNPDAQKLATANADFFAHFVTLSNNPALQRGITSVVHQIRLGSLHLPEYIDLRALSVAQDLLVHAARDHDKAAALGSMRMLGLIEVPLDEVVEPRESVGILPTES